jgi:hypothetical protein
MSQEYDDAAASSRVVWEIAREIDRARQHDINAHHNVGGYDDGAQQNYEALALRITAQCAEAAVAGTLTWRLLILADYYTAFGETSPEVRREHLLRLAATVVANIADLDRREFAGLVAEPELVELAGRADSVAKHPSTRTWFSAEARAGLDGLWRQSRHEAVFA